MALHFALNEGHTANIEALVDNGADINTVTTKVRFLIVNNSIFITLFTVLSLFLLL